MSDRDKMMALAKVVIAVAWADGEVTRDEVNYLKTMLFRLPKLTAREWSMLDMYIESPVDEAERMRLVEDLQNQIASPSEKEFVLNALEDLVKADGAVTDEEEQVASSVEAAIEDVHVGSGGGILQLVRTMINRSPTTKNNAPNREEYFDDFVKNKVYYSVRWRLDLDNGEVTISDEDLRKLSLAGGIMAQIARANPEITDSEFDTMVNALQSGWDINLEEATFVTEVAVSDTVAKMDKFHLMNEFRKVCTVDELSRFLDILFAIASADGEASPGEVDEIQSMAHALNLPKKSFVQAKRKSDTISENRLLTSAASKVIGGCPACRVR